MFLERLVDGVHERFGILDDEFGIDLDGHALETDAETWETFPEQDGIDEFFVKSVPPMTTVSMSSMSSIPSMTAVVILPPEQHVHESFESPVDAICVL